MKDPCDHLIGVFTDDSDSLVLIHLSEKLTWMDYFLKKHKDWASTGYAVKQLVEHYKSWTREQHYKENVEEFDYCPKCGVKNDL